MRWSKSEELFLKENYGRLSLSEIAKRIGRSYKAVKGKASSMRLMDKKNVWSDEQVEYLKEAWSNTPRKIIAEKLQKPVSVVFVKAKDIGLIRKRWTKKEEDYLRKHYSKKSVKAIANELGRDVGSVISKKSKLGLRRQQKWGWEDSELQYLKENYGNKTAKLIAEELNKNVDSVYYQINKMDLGTNTWTNEQEEYLVENYGRIATTIIAKDIGKSPMSVYAKANHIGLKCIEQRENHHSKNNIAKTGRPPLEVNRVRFATYIDEELNKKVRIYAAYNELKLNDVLEEALREYFNKRKQEITL